MNLKVNTRFEELTLAVKVNTTYPCKIRLKVYDFERPKTVFTNRFKTINGIETLYVRLPLSSKNVVISVYNQANGNLRPQQDNSFTVVKVDKIPLEKRTDTNDIKDVVVRSFVDFAQRFAYNAAYLKDNETYVSQDGKYKIEYLPVLKSSKTGQTLKTPARISNSTGKIQASKQYFSQYTVPMILMILFHEYAHFYKNEDIRNESEADLNGLWIYLSLGYPRIEAYQAFLKVFIGTPSPQNKNRYDIINKFINDFENKKIVIQ